MEKIKLNNGNEYYLPTYSETSNGLDLTVSGFLVSEIKSLTEDDLKVVQISEGDTVYGEYSNMELGDSISYNTAFDQTNFSLQKNGMSDLNEKVKELEQSVESINPISETMEKLVSVTETSSDKMGYNWRITSIGNVEVLKEYVKNDESQEEHDGSDYTKPAYYVEGSSVEKGKWYCEETATDLRYECIKSGTPSSFNDAEYFNIVIG